MAKRSSRRRKAQPKSRLSPYLIAGVFVAALVLVAGVILLTRPSPQQQASPVPTLPSTLDYETGVTEEGYPYKGSADAKVTVIEFADYQCEFCADAEATLMPRIDEDFVRPGLIRFIYQDFAFLGPESKTAAQAAHCAKEQGRFWEYHHVLFANQGQPNSGAFARAKLERFAEQVGLDVKAFKQCLSSKKYADLVTASTAEGRRRGLRGTPTFFVGDRMLEGAVPYEELKTAIELALREAE
jgi:protein-disulfide isomerase